MVRHRLWNFFLAVLPFDLLGGFLVLAVLNFMEMLRALVVFPIEGPPLVFFFCRSACFPLKG